MVGWVSQVRRALFSHDMTEMETSQKQAKTLVEVSVLEISACSSAGLSSGLLNRRSLVRIQSGVFSFCLKAVVEHPDCSAAPLFSGFACQNQVGVTSPANPLTLFQLVHRLARLLCQSCEAKVATTLCWRCSSDLPRNSFATAIQKLFLHCS